MTKRLLEFVADRRARWLCILGILSSMCFAGVLFLSLQFQHEDGHALRPIREVLALLAGASVCYLAALFIVLKQRSWRSFFNRAQSEENTDAVSPQNDRQSLWVVLAFAVVFRALLLFSQPIQEIDYYRYLWDGRVLLSGNNPFRFSPKQIEEWQTADAGRESRRALFQLANSSAPVNDVFKRVHHRQVPTVYPPLAQVVFAFSCALTPADVPLWVHVTILKSVLLLFDMGTILVLIGILRYLRLPRVWCLSYAWCPLVIKEIANSAHLDSIAVFFTALSVLAAIALWKKAAGKTDETEVKPKLHSPGKPDLRRQAAKPIGLAVQWFNQTALANPERTKLVLGCAAAACLALGVLGKTYPLVLLPVLIGFLLPHLRIRVVVPVAVFAMILGLAYAPFLLDKMGTNASVHAQPSAVAANADGQNNPLTGLKTFLSHWQMNDFLFMLVHENLRAPVAASDRFFVIVPREIRQSVHQFCTHDLVSMGIHLSGRDPAFLLVQGSMGLFIASLSVFWAVKLMRKPEPKLLLRGVFLVLVWAWLLNPAQNPWYLLWCLPFMVFEGRRSWFLLPVTGLLYYFRFWLEYRGWSNPAAPDLELANRLRDVYDYGIVWLEYLPFFTLFGLESIAIWKMEATAKATAKIAAKKNHRTRNAKKPRRTRDRRVITQNEKKSRKAS